MKLAQHWTDAATAHARTIAQPYRVVGFDRSRPLFTAETDWPFPDGRYWFVTNSPPETDAVTIEFCQHGYQHEREFSDWLHAERVRDQLNHEKPAPRPARSVNWKTTARTGRPETSPKPPGEKSLRFNRYTARPKAR